MNEAELKQQLTEIAQEAFPDTLDPWPTLKGLLQISDRKAHPRGFAMKTQTTRMKIFPPAARVAAILGLALLLASAIFLITPQGHAWAQDLLRFFTRAASNSVPAPTAQPLNWVILTPGAATHTPAPTLTLPGQAFFPDCGDIRRLQCSVEQVREKVGFPVKELGVLPEDMQFTGATGNPDTTWIVYDRTGKDGRLLLIQEPWKDSPEQKSWMLGASAAVEIVKIGQVTGEYAKGSFTYKAGETQQHWDPNMDVQILLWEADGIFTVIEYVGDDTLLNRDGLVALATSLTTQSVDTRVSSASPTAIPTEESADLHNIYPLTIQEAEQQVGWKLLEPTRLPDILSFYGATLEIDPAQPAITTLFYRLDQQWGPNTNGVLIREQKIPTSGACKLCGFVIGQYTGKETAPSGMTVGANATIQAVSIGEFSGQYVEGVWKGTDQGWVYDLDPNVKTLRWQANGVAFEVTYFGEEITKEDMVAIAASMK